MQNIFIVGVIVLSISNSWTSIETKWCPVSSSIDTKDTIFKRKFQFQQQIFHCSKKFEMAKSRESSFKFVKTVFWALLRVHGGIFLGGVNEAFFAIWPISSHVGVQIVRELVRLITLTGLNKFVTKITSPTSLKKSSRTTFRWSIVKKRSFLVF